MKLTVGNLRKLIKSALVEAGGGTTMPPRPVTRDPMSSPGAEREQISKNSIVDKDDPEQISPHLQDPLYDNEDCYGPVPPNAEQPYALPDPFAQNFSVLPTPQIRR